MTVMLFAGCGSNTQADTRAENTVSEQRGNRSAYGIFAWIWSVKNGMDDNTGWKEGWSDMFLIKDTVYF